MRVSFAVVLTLARRTVKLTMAPSSGMGGKASHGENKDEDKSDGHYEAADKENHVSVIMQHC